MNKLKAYLDSIRDASLANEEYILEPVEEEIWYRILQMYRDEEIWDTNSLEWEKTIADYLSKNKRIYIYVKFYDHWDNIEDSACGQWFLPGLQSKEEWLEDNSEFKNLKWFKWTNKISNKSLGKVK